MNKLACAIVILPMLMLVACATQRPQLGVSDHKLAPCPSPPRCVSSQAPIPDVNHTIPGFIPIISPADAWPKLVEIVRTMPRTQIVDEQPNYLYAEVTTPIMRFVDDFELYYDEDSYIIDVRSSSRIGYWDGGLNRDRVENFRVQLREAGVVR